MDGGAGPITKRMATSSPSFGKYLATSPNPDAIKVIRSFDERWFRDRGLEEIHKQLDEPSFTAAWERGATMSPDEAVAYALE